MGSRNRKFYSKEEHVKRVGKHIIDNIKSDIRSKRHLEDDYDLRRKVDVLFLDYKCNNDCPVRLDYNFISGEFTLIIYEDNNQFFTELPILEIIREEKLKEILENGIEQN